jgi:hypothetical protein
MIMYSSDELKELNKTFPPKAIDDDLVSRVPTKGLDFIMGYKMSPEGTQKTIEKMGMLGLFNSYLVEQRLSVEEIMSALSGDMVFAMNNYQQTKETLLFDSTDLSSSFSNYKTDLDVLFALKLNKKAAFEKIIQLAIDLQMLEKSGQNAYKLKSLGSMDSSVILVNDQYAVFANKPKLANSFLNGKDKKENAQLISSYVKNQPFSMVFDFNTWARRTGAVMANNAADTLVYQAAINMFDNFVFNGGKLRENKYEYKMSLNFLNKNESSLLQLLDFGKVLKEAQDLRDKDAAMYEEIQRQNADSLLF